MEAVVNVPASPTSGQSHYSPELRLVLIGGRHLNGIPSNKSITGNIILGKSVFDTSRRTARSVVRQQEAHGRQVTVVDTPGWWWHYPQENTPKLDQVEIRNSVHLCPPGPHAFLLVIPVGLKFHRISRLSLEEHLQLFHKEVLRHTIVLFTLDAPCNDDFLEYEIAMCPDLKWVLEQCGNRKHFFNISDRQDSSQVITLFKKIDAVVAENAGSHYPIDGNDGKALKENMKAIAERASKRSAEVQAKREKLKALIAGGKIPPTHLRIVMVGAQWSAKSSAGNTILGKQAFAVQTTDRRTTEYCEISHGVVANRKLTVVDSPGWFYNETLRDTCEMDKLEIQSSMHLCPPGPHVVLLVVGLASAFNASYQQTVQEHMSLFTDDIWKHTIVLFTRGDWLGVKTVEERIESEKGLQWLVTKCGNMYHVLDNVNQRDETQVVELLEKIGEMWAGKKDPHFEVNLALAKQMEARKEARESVAKGIRRTAEIQAGLLRELFRGERLQITDMRVILLGRKESGKSMVGNRMIFDELFNTMWMKKEFQAQESTAMCVKHQRKVAGINLSIVEAPGWPTDRVIPNWLKREALHSVSMCAPGPHAFLLIIPVLKSFTEKDCKAAVELLMPFGERVWRHCMLLFTWGDWLNNRPIEEYIAMEGKHLKWLLEKCGNRYSVIRCNRYYEDFPVIQLFQKISDMIMQNKGRCFTPKDEEQTPGQPTLTEEEWNRREQELIDRMLKAVARESKEPSRPSVKMTASLDGVFIPSMSGDVHSEDEGTFCYQRARFKVSEWLTCRAENSDVTSGVGSISASASHTEKLDESILTNDYRQSMNCFFPEKDKIKFDTVLHGGLSTDAVGTQRRHSF
nr:GTPase IMAP family member 8-like isoform X2 [Scatophagus argus]